MSLYTGTYHPSSFKQTVKFSGGLCLSPELYRTAEQAKQSAASSGADDDHAKTAFANAVYTAIGNNSSDNARSITVRAIKRVMSGGKYLITNGSDEAPEAFSFRGDTQKPVGITFLVDDARRGGPLSGNDESAFGTYVAERINDGRPLHKSVIKKEGKAVLPEFVAQDSNTHFVYIG